MDFLAIIYFIIGTLVPNQDMYQSVENLEKYYEAVAVVESDMKHHARNKHSSAKSYFQVTNGTFATAKKRAARMGYVVMNRSITSLSYKEQRDLLFLDFYQRNGTNPYIIGILRGDKDIALQAYFKFHHTNPDWATKKRAYKIFGEYYEN